MTINVRVHSQSGFVTATPYNTNGDAIPKIARSPSLDRSPPGRPRGRHEEPTTIRTDTTTPRQT